MCPHGCPHKRAKLKGRYRLLQAATRFDLFSLSRCNISPNDHSVTPHHNASDSAQILHTQEAPSSSLGAPTIVFNRLQACSSPETPDCYVDCDVTPPDRHISVHPRRFLLALRNAAYQPRP